ncbi:MAG: alpha/beta hydrolase, partial [Myxococcota bacterium]
MTSLETTDGVTLGYRVQGSGPPLLFVHGWMTSGDLWSPTLATLADRFTCVVPDLRGTGASSSDTADYSLQRQAKDLVELLDHLDLHDVVVVGHSMGGPIACGVAIGAPARVRCLVLTNPVPFDGLDLPDEIVALFRTSAGNRDKQGAILDAASPHLHDDERTRLLDVAGPIPEPCIVGAFDAWTGGAFGERAAEI